MAKIELMTAAMDNVDAWRLGEIARDAGNLQRDGVGDLIDRGLILRRLLEENGYGLVKLPANAPLTSPEAERTE
jgi:hypothetical protein